MNVKRDMLKHKNITYKVEFTTTYAISAYHH